MKHGTKVVTLLLLAVLLVGCKSTAEKEKLKREEQQSHEFARINHEIADLCSRYSAIVEWPQQLKEKKFSIDVAPIFLRADKRPDMFYATLEDIKEQNDTILLYFRSEPTEGEPILQLILDCAGCNLQALKNQANSDGDFVVFAHAAAVDKLLDQSEDGPDYVLHGKFIDARFIGDYATEKVLKTIHDK